MLLLSLFMLIGAAFCVWAMVLAWRGLKTRSWPSVEGVVIRSWVVETGSNVGRNSSGRVLYYAEVEYAYAINGKAMRGDRIAMGPVSSGTRGTVEAKLAKWPENATVRVYYNPSDSSSCVLVTGPNWPAVLRSALPGAFFLGISILFFAELSDSGLLG